MATYACESGERISLHYQLFSFLGDARLSGRSCIWKQDIFVHSVSLLFVSPDKQAAVLRNTAMNGLCLAGGDRSAGLYRGENSFICSNVHYEA